MARVQVPGLNVDMSQVRRALVVLSIEKALLDIGKQDYDAVIERLETEHHCYLRDCCENPSCLQNVLRELFGRSSESIIKSIGKNLEEFSDNKQIGRFLEVICS